MLCYNITVMKKKLMNITLILTGTFMLAMSVEFFILPYRILSGGVAGIAVALKPFFDIDETMFANTAVLALLIIGRMVLGREFAYRTLLSSLAYPVFTTLLARYPVQITIEPVLASFYAGLLGGAGIGLVMRTGASTGGMDIPPLILNKLTGIKIATLVMITDALTVLLGVLAYDINAALIGMISVFSSAVGIDKVLQLGQAAEKSVQIISENWEQIVSVIDEDLNRGCTLLNGEGGYQRSEKKVVLCIVSNSEYSKLLERIEEIDDKAFIITTEVSNVRGEGFTYSSPNI